LTGGVLAREFYDTMHVPILYIDLDTYLPRRKLVKDFMQEFEKLIYGTHYISGRITDIPLASDYGAAESAGMNSPPDTGLQDLTKLGLSGSLALGSWQVDVLAHGSGSPNLPKTDAEREERGKEGAEMVRNIVKQMNLKAALAGLQAHDDYTNKVMVPKYGTILLGPGDLK
jgi:hypothetical protein